MRLFVLGLLVACSGGCERNATHANAPADAGQFAVAVVESTNLRSVLAKQPEATQNRYKYRHPEETLEFFGVESGMTVVEALPGGGWYSKLLLAYLGPHGQLIGANYAYDLWTNFDFADQQYLRRMRTWTADWPADARAWQITDAASVDAFVFGELPQAMHETADVVLLIRALHNIARFSNPEHDYLQQALADVYAILKPGGVVGVVQHEAHVDMSDAWADGSNGYLKRQFVIDAMQSAGFTYRAASDVNQNDKDVPTADEFVWRLPPSYQTAGSDPAKRAPFDVIGESNRMTLKFTK
jgi:predicted methyltransferase